MSGRAAAFLDRDGTIIRDASYVSDPRDVEILPGAAAAIRRLNTRGIAVIVITNQSGIARAYFGLEEYERVRSRIDELLRAEGARIDATYMCPHYPPITGPCDCRKPGTELFRRAIEEHGLDARHSVFIGDRIRDILPARSLGGRAIMLDVESTPPEDRERARREWIPTAGSLDEAVNEFLAALPASRL